MDKFLEICNLPRLNHVEIANMDKPVTRNEIESVLGKTPSKRDRSLVQDQMASQANSTRHSEES